MACSVCARQGSGRFSASRPRVVRCTSITTLMAAYTETYSETQSKTQPKNALFRIFFDEIANAVLICFATGVQIPHLSAFKTEKEVLLRPGMSAVSILNISTFCFKQDRLWTAASSALTQHSFLYGAGIRLCVTGAVDMRNICCVSNRTDPSQVYRDKLRTAFNL